MAYAAPGWCISPHNSYDHMWKTEVGMATSLSELQQGPNFMVLSPRLHIKNEQSSLTYSPVRK